MKKPAWAGLALLYLLHNDVWLWSEPHRLPWAWSLPAGFVYHVVFCLAAALLFWLIVRHHTGGGRERAGDRP